MPVSPETRDALEAGARPIANCCAVIYVLGAAVAFVALIFVLTWHPWVHLDRGSDCPEWDQKYSWQQPYLDEKVDFLEDLGFSTLRAEELVPLVNRFCRDERSEDRNVAEAARTLDAIERQLR